MSTDEQEQVPPDEGGDGGDGGGTVGRGTEFQGGPPAGMALISGTSFANKAVVYADIEGMAIFEADIALGTVEEVRASNAQARDAAIVDPGSVSFGVVISGARFRWPKCQVPYEIDPKLPNPSRVTEAIAHWEAKTPLRFPLRTTANAKQFPNYVRFTDAGGCWSLVGMAGGPQTISLGANCTTGNTVHEIGHAVGLWHEQSRQDRDLFVSVKFANIIAGMEHNFDQHITDGDDVGTYDYASIMHYPRKAFSKNGQDTLVPTKSGVEIGQRTALSTGDIAAVKAIYPNSGGVTKLPTKDRPPSTFKKFFDDRGGWKWFFSDPGQRAGDPYQGTLGGLAGFQRRGAPGGDVLRRLPFTLAAPHHAQLTGDAGEAGDGAGGGDLAAYVSDLETELLELEAAIASALAVSAQGAAEAARLGQAARALAAEYEQARQALEGGAGGA